MDDAFFLAVNVKRASKLWSAISSAAEGYAEDPCNLVQDVSDSLGVLFPEQVHPEVARESVCGNHKGFACHMK